MGGRPAFPRGAALLHRPQHHLAGATGAIWQLEQRLEEVLASEPVGRVRGLLPTARRAERHGTFGAVLRQHHGTRSRFCGRRQRGQQDQALGRSRGDFSTKIHLKTDFKGLPLDFHLTGGEASDCVEFETSLDIGPDIRPRLVVTDKGYDSRANRDAARARGITPMIPRRAPPRTLTLSDQTLQDQGSDRAGGRQAQTI